VKWVTRNRIEVSVLTWMKISTESLAKDQCRTVKRECASRGGVEGNTCKVEVILPLDDFSWAIGAFKQPEIVRVLDKPTRAGRQYVLGNPWQFGVRVEE